MKKSFILAPLAMTLSALLPTASNATAPQIEKPSIAASAIAGATAAATDLVLEPAKGASVQMAAHNSHASHASHASHRSHVSHYSSSF